MSAIIIGGIVILVNLPEDELIEVEPGVTLPLPDTWEWPDREGPPPPLIWNERDDDECRYVVEGYYEDAINMYESGVES